MNQLPLPSRTLARLLVAAATVAVALLIAEGSAPLPSSAATITTGSLATPRPDGLTVGFAGTSNPQLFANAQPFEVASVSMFNISSQTWSSYVPGAPAFANSLTIQNLRADSIVFVRRGPSSVLGTPVPLAGAPEIEILDQPQRFEVPPPNGLTLGISGTTSPEALAASQFFNTQTMNVWSIQQQRYLTYIPGAPAIVNTLSAANLRATDFVWLKAIGGVTGGVVAEDTPFLARLVPFGEAGTLIGLGAPAHGELIDNGDGSVTYIPEKNFAGDDSFTYTVMTPTGPEERLFRIEVTEENDTPIANDDAATAEAGVATIIDVLENDEDPDEDPLKILRTTQPAHGIVAVFGTSVLYTPEEDFDGVDVFEYEITDGISEPGDRDAIGTVFVAVGGAALAGPPPLGGGGGGAGGGGGGAGGGSVPGGDEGGGAGGAFLTDDSAHLDTCDAPTVIDVLANDAGDGETVLVVTSVSAPALGSSANNGDGTVTYTPPVDCTGSTSFTYTVPDADAVDQTATVTITMGDEPVGGDGDNEAPEAVDDSASTFENTPVTIAVLANDSDPDGDDLTVTAVTQPGGGSVVNNGDGTVTYSAGGFVGNTSFTYTVTDGQGGEATASVSVAVEGGAVAPVGPVTVQAGGQVTIQVVTPSSFVQLESVTNGSHGTTSMSAGAGTVTYHPDATYSGDDWITWTLRFSHGGTAQTTLHLKVVN